MTELIIAYINSLIDPLGHFDKIYGLCEIVKDQGAQAPKLYSGSGTYEDISFDEHNGVIYHRLNGEISQSENTQFNSPRQIYDRTYPFKAVAIFPKSILDIDDEYIGEKIAENVVSVITSQRTSALTASIKATNSVVNLVGISTDRSEIQNSEWAGDIDIDFNYAVIAIDYEVVITAFKSCFEINSCDGVTIPDFNVVTVNDALNPNSPILLKPNSSYTCETGSCDDATVNVNGDLFDTVASGGTLNVPVVNQDDVQVGFLNVDGKWQVNSVLRGYNYGYQSGQDEIFSFGDESWINANYWANFSNSQLSGIRNEIDPTDWTKILPNDVFPTNIFGNLERFTGSTGTSVLTNDEMYDHHTGLMTYRQRQIAPDFETGLLDALGTDFGGNNSTNGRTDWFLLNITQLYGLAKQEEGSGNIFGWSPLSLPSSNITSSTTYINDSTECLYLSSSGRSLSLNKSSAIQYIFGRKFS